MCQLEFMSGDEIVSREAGKLSVIAVLDADPRAVEPNQIGEIQVLETWIDGKPIHRAKSQL